MGHGMREQTNETGQSEKRSWKRTSFLGKEKIRSPGWCLWPSGRPNFPPGVYFALCLSLMVLSLLETIFITYLLHLATTQPPPMPHWLYSLLLHCTSPRTCCPTVPWKGNMDLAHLPGEGCQHCSCFLFHHLRFSAPTSFPPHITPQLTLEAHS